MGIEKLTDEEIKKLATTPGAFQAFMQDKNNQKRVFGVDHIQRRRIADILKYDAGMSKADVKKIIDKMAFVHSSVTDFF